MRRVARHICRPLEVAASTMCVRWQSTAASSTTSASASASAGASTDHQESVLSAMERAAAARREIYDLWRTVSDQEITLSNTTASEGGAEKQAAIDAERVATLSRIMDTYKMDISCSREEDVSRGLGDALDRLLLLCVPLPASSGTEQLERVLQLAGRQGRQLSVRSVQHLFARTSSYAEALAVFYALRRCHFAMNIEAYHAMLYSLQRLEEEGWAMRFHDEYVEGNGGNVSEQALDFVLRGVDTPLMPENKPWLGRIMFAESSTEADRRSTRQSYDELGKLWVERYKTGASGSR